MSPYARLAAALAPLLLLSACLLTPGKFVSALDVRKDGGFTFSYQGEVVVSDPGDGMKDMGDGGDSSGFDEAPESDGAAYYQQIASKSSKSSGDADADKDKQAKIQAIADALAKEKGFRSARYLGGNKIAVDYEISGKLDHAFIFPFNVDAQAIIPFVAIELRKDGKIRIQAPGFGSENDKPGGGMGPMGGDNSAKEREGTFTLTTDAEIVSQNQEDGAANAPNGKRIVWKVTPLTRTAPMAVLQLATP